MGGSVPVWVNNAATSVGNSMIVICAAMIVWGGAVWVRRYGAEKPQSAAIMSALITVIGVFGIRIGYWNLAIATAPEGEYYHPVFVDYKWLMTIVCGVAAMYFTKRLFISLHCYTESQIFWFYLGVAAVSIGISAI